MRICIAHMSRIFVHMNQARAGRRATNVSVSEALVDEARALGINLSQACERGLAEEVAERRRARWLAENRQAIEDCNMRIERHGPTLAAYRRF
jgi:antitoxin CcdA